MRIVEIGPYTYPLYKTSEKHIGQLEKGASYIAVDSTLNGAQVARLWHQDKWKIASVRAEASELPLPNSSVDEIWLLNVFSDFHGGTKAVKKDELTECLQECLRVTKQEGTVFIGEWYTPEKVKWITEVDFSREGFSKKIYRGTSLHNFMKKLGHTGPTGYKTIDGSFLIALTKK